MCGKYSMRGGVKLQIQHKANPSAACICHETPPQYCIFQVKSALTDLLLYGEDYEQQHSGNACDYSDELKT